MKILYLCLEIIRSIGSVKEDPPHRSSLDDQGYILGCDPNDLYQKMREFHLEDLKRKNAKYN